MYTTGTTGCPKGCALTHGHFLNLSVNTKMVEPEIANSATLYSFLAVGARSGASDSGTGAGRWPGYRPLPILRTWLLTWIVSSRPCCWWFLASLRRYTRAPWRRRLRAVSSISRFERSTDIAGALVGTKVKAAYPSAGGTVRSIRQAGLLEAARLWAASYVTRFRAVAPLASARRTLPRGRCSGG